MYRNGHLYFFSKMSDHSLKCMQVVLYYEYEEYFSHQVENRYLDFILLNCKHNLNFIIKASLLVIIFTIWCKIRIFFHAPVSILCLPPRAALLPLGESLTIFSVTNFVPTNLLNEFQSSIINVKCFLLLFNEFHFKPISN